MSRPSETTIETRNVDGNLFDIVRLDWPAGAVLYDVYLHAADDEGDDGLEPLTAMESLTSVPDDDGLRDLLPTKSGHVTLTVRIDVADAYAVLAAGRRSYARDLTRWVPGMSVTIPDDVADVIPNVDQAVTDLLVEAWVRCYGGYTSHPPFIEAIPDAEWGDINDKDWHPAKENA